MECLNENVELESSHDEAESSYDDTESSHDEMDNMTLTENCSPTYVSTTSACLDFFFQVLQNSPKEHIVECLKKAWEEDSLLTLKLVFHLRDIRQGKGAMIEFHHCLTWLFYNHPSTLIHNLEYVAQHGYWKDLSWLVKFLVYNKVETTTRPPVAKKTSNCMFPGMSMAVGRRRRFMHYHGQPSNIRFPASVDTNQTNSLEELIRKRVDGTIEKRVWKNYLKHLPDERSKKVALAKFQEVAKEIHVARSQEAKLKKKSAKAEAKEKLVNFKLACPNFFTLYEKVVDLFTQALLRDRETFTKNKSLPTNALAAKWAPTIGDSIDFYTSLGKNIARSLRRSIQPNGSEESESEFDIKAYTSYRVDFLTPLRACICVPEKYLSEKKCCDIDYQRVPSVCMKRNKEIFLRADAERFKQYLDDVQAGKKKIASGALLPHEIVTQFMHGDFSLNEELEKVGELQWNSYVENLRKAGLFESALAICDVSGSMSGIPMVVAIALSLLTAALSKPPFNNVICTFSESPSLQKIDQATLKEKVSFVRDMEWGMNTNLQAVFNLLLELARKTNLPKEEMVKTLFIFSDMEFDECGGRKYETDYEVIKRNFDEAGYQVPAIVFWNLRGGHRSKPVTKNEKNVALVSGFSGQMMKTFLETGEIESPYQVMLSTLGTKYDHLKVVD